MLQIFHFASSKCIYFTTNYYSYIRLSTTSLCYKFNATQINQLTLKFFKKEPALRSRSKPKEIPLPFTSLKKQLQFQEPATNWRVKKINKILLEKITEIIVTSEIAPQVAGKGFEITKLHSSCSSIQVLWSTSIAENFEVLSSILLRTSPIIRHELCNQRIIGRVPPIIFVKDEIRRMSQEVEILIQKSSSYLTLTDSLDLDYPKQQNEAENTEDKQIESLEDKLLETWPLKQDIFGVDREKIINTVKRNRSPDETINIAKTGLPMASPAVLCKEGVGRKVVGLFSYSRTAEIRKWAEQYRKSQKKARMQHNRQMESLSYVKLGDDQDTNDQDYKNDFENYTSEFEGEDYMDDFKDSDDSNSQA